MENEVWSGLGGFWGIENKAWIIKALKVLRAGCFFHAFYAILPDFGRHLGALGIQLGRQVGLKCPFWAENEQKITKKSIQEGFHKKREQIMNKLCRK